VILAAVIGAFVLGFGGGGPSAPSVNWETTDDGASNPSVDFTHTGGDTIQEASTLQVSVGSRAFVDNDGDGEVGTGDVIEANSVGSSTDEVILVWESPDGDSSQELATHNL
jgi:FlaG/FlaF family flagellin (archaellin)